MTTIIDRFLKARAKKNPVSDTVSIYLFSRPSVGRIAIATEVIFKEMDESHFFSVDETIALPYQTAQELMDSLWDCGLRPSEGSGSAGALKATENHLKNIQQISDRLLAMVEKQIKNG